MFDKPVQHAKDTEALLAAANAHEGRVLLLLHRVDDAMFTRTMLGCKELQNNSPGHNPAQAMTAHQYQAAVLHNTVACLLAACNADGLASNHATARPT